MTLVIEESEDVTLELLTPILGVLKKHKEVRCNLWVGYAVLLVLKNLCD